MARFHAWVGVTWAHSSPGRTARTAARGRVEQQVEVRAASRQTGSIREQGKYEQHGDVLLLF